MNSRRCASVPYLSSDGTIWRSARSVRRHQCAPAASLLGDRNRSRLSARVPPYSTGAVMPSYARRTSAAVKSSSQPDNQASTEVVGSGGGELLGQECARTWARSAAGAVTVGGDRRNEAGRVMNGSAISRCAIDARRHGVRGVAWRPPCPTSTPAGWPATPGEAVWPSAGMYMGSCDPFSELGCGGEQFVVRHDPLTAPHASAVVSTSIRSPVGSSPPPVRSRWHMRKPVPAVPGTRPEFG